MTARIYSLKSLPGYVPVTLSGHRAGIVGAFFAGEGDVLYTVSKDAATFVWEWMERDALPSGALTVMHDGSDDEEGSAEHSSRKPASFRASNAMLASRNRFHDVPDPCAAETGSEYSILKGEWRLLQKHFFMQEHAKVCAVCTPVALACSPPPLLL
jgi:hypothetical protein